MDRLISEQAVIDRLSHWYSDMLETGKEQEDLIEVIKAIPSAEPKWNRLYSWLNDMRYGIAPDETVTDIDERNVRTAQVDMLDEIMEWMIEPQERSDKE